MASKNSQNDEELDETMELCPNCGHMMFGIRGSCKARCKICGFKESCSYWSSFLPMKKYIKNPINGIIKDVRRVTAQRILNSVLFFDVKTSTIGSNDVVSTVIIPASSIKSTIKSPNIDLKTETNDGDSR